MMNRTESSMPCAITHTSAGSNLVGRVLSPVFFLAMILGLLGNTLALWIFCCRVKSWKPNTLFLFNLMLADFLLLTCMPLGLDVLLWGQWRFGDAWCPILLFSMFSNRSASIAFMTLVAVHRYLKVVHPHHRLNRMTTAQAGWLAGSIWVLVFSLRIPILLFDQLMRYGNNSKMCFPFKPEKEPSEWMVQVYIQQKILNQLDFFIPLGLLLFCTARISCILRRRQMARQRKVRRAMRVLAVIVGVFFICFLPFSATSVAAKLIEHFQPRDCALFRVLVKVYVVSFGFNYLNSALDPMIYCFSSCEFRRTLKTLRTSMCSSAQPVAHSTDEAEPSPQQLSTESNN